MMSLSLAPNPDSMARLAAGLLVVVLAGCGSNPVRPTSDISAGASEESSAAVAVAPIPDGLQRFEAQRLQQARQAEQAGRLADAASAWEVLAVLSPDNTEYRQHALAAQQAVDQAVVQRLARAQAARQKGDVVMAERLFLEVLALDPGHGPSASALREMEAERNRASVVGRFAQPPNLAARNGKTSTAANTGPMPRGAAASPSLSTQTPSQRNQYEHASLLASQGELDAAIAQLTDGGGSKPKDAESRQLLARLYAQRGDQRVARDPKAARADMDRALDLDPSLKETRAKLQTLPR